MEVERGGSLWTSHCLSNKVKQKFPGTPAYNCRTKGVSKRCTLWALALTDPHVFTSYKYAHPALLCLGSAVCKLRSKIWNSRERKQQSLWGKPGFIHSLLFFFLHVVEELLGEVVHFSCEKAMLFEIGLQTPGLGCFTSCLRKWERRNTHRVFTTNRVEGNFHFYKLEIWVNRGFKIIILTNLSRWNLLFYL